jgi:hypothetical protein
LISLTLVGQINVKDLYIDSVLDATEDCRYYSIAEYMLTVRTEKRKSAWKRIIREQQLFFQLAKMKKFEEVSKQYGLEI